MRFLLGVLLGYSMRGKKRLLITVLAIGAVIIFIVIPGIFLTGLAISERRERLARPIQTQVPSVKGMTYESAETKLRASKLNIRLLATRYYLPLQPGIIVDQSPPAGDHVNLGYPVGVTITKKDP